MLSNAPITAVDVVSAIVLHNSRCGSRYTDIIDVLQDNGMTPSSVQVKRALLKASKHGVINQTYRGLWKLGSGRRKTNQRPTMHHKQQTINYAEHSTRIRNARSGRRSRKVTSNINDSDVLISPTIRAIPAAEDDEPTSVQDTATVNSESSECVAATEDAVAAGDAEFVFGNAVIGEH